MGKEWFIIGRIPAEKNPILEFGFIQAELAGKKKLRHMALGIISEPGINMNRTDLGLGAVLFTNRLNLFPGFVTETRGILVEIDGQIIEPAKLILRDPGAGNSTQNSIPHTLQTLLLLGIGNGGMEHPHRPPLPPIAGKGPVLAYNRFYGPLPDDQVAPSRRPSGNRNHLNSGPLKPPQSGVRLGKKLSFAGQGIINVCEKNIDPARRFRG